MNKIRPRHPVKGYVLELLRMLALCLVIGIVMYALPAPYGVALGSGIAVVYSFFELRAILRGIARGEP